MDIKNNIYDFYYQQLTQTSIYNTLYLNTVFFQNCNYNCSYCFQDKDYNEKLNLKNFENVLSKLIKFKNIDRYIFSIMGGELSLADINYQKNIFLILNKYLKNIPENKFKKIVYVTNFSKDFNNIYNKYFEVFNNACLLDIAITHHYEYISAEDIFEKTIKDFNIQKLKLNRNIIFTIKTFDLKAFDILNKLNKDKKILIEYGDKNWKIQKQIFSKIKKDIRPVLCNAWNYNLVESGNLYHLCTLEKIDIENIKQSKIICKQRCSNYEIEQDTFKKILKRK